MLVHLREMSNPIFDTLSRQKRGIHCLTVLGDKVDPGE